MMTPAIPVCPGLDTPAMSAVCGRCGAPWGGYSVPPPYGGTLDARFEMRLCDRCFSLFVRWCAVFFGVDLPPDPWSGQS